MDKCDKSYFGKDKLKMLKSALDEIIALLDEKPIEFSNKI
jgi:hypothetical protein